MMRMLHRGFTLIELLVAMTITIVLLLMAMPRMVLWMSDSEIRNGAQSVAEGLRTAQAAAISRNFNVQFVMSASDWTVQMADPPNTVLLTAPFIEGSKNVTFNAVDVSSSAASTVTFNPLGQVIANAANIARVDVTLPAVSGTRPLRVIVGNLTGGTTFYGVKLCDPSFPATDPKGCP
jgi:type IV fimbrial biogenesis protein FimT